jgi:hypothetical protein
VYLFLTGGPKLYDTLSANLPVPNRRTITRFVEKQENMMEGILQIKQLQKFLDDNKYTKKIWLSEDGTKIIEKIQFDGRNNQLVGIVLAFDKNGMPILDQSTADSAIDIKLLMTKEKATMLYIIMAKPIAPKSKSFCLCYYGTSNKFKTDDVLNRWMFIEKELAKIGVEVVGYSADGDSRLLRSMRILSGLPSIIDSKMPSAWRSWFCSSFKPDRPVGIQDTVHIGAKFRTRLLKKDKPIKIGKLNHIKNTMNKALKFFRFIENKNRAEKLPIFS